MRIFWKSYQKIRTSQKIRTCNEISVHLATLRVALSNEMSHVFIWVHKQKLERWTGYRIILVFLR